MTFFDTQSAPEMPKFETIPEGKYRVLVTGGEEKKSNTSGTMYFVATLTVLDEPHKNRRLQAKFFLNASTDKGRAFNAAKLRSLLTCCGVTSKLESPNDFVRLAGNKVLICSVKIEKDQRGDDQNVVDRFYALGDAPAAQAPKAAAAYTPPSSPVTQAAIEDLPF